MINTNGYLKRPNLFSFCYILVILQIIRRIGNSWTATNYHHTQGVHSLVKQQVKVQSAV